MEKGTGQKVACFASSAHCVRSLTLRLVVSLLWRETGIALPMTLVVMAALLGLGSAGLIFSRSDLMISKNVVDGTKALWSAGAGAEIGKNWLEANLSGGPYPTTLGPTTLADGTYTVTIDRYTTGVNDGRFRITSTGTGPNNASKTVEEVVRVPGLNVQGAISIDGNGTNAQFDLNYNSNAAIPLSAEVPSFSIDGRNHDRNGNLSTLCQDLSPISGTSGNVNTDVNSKVNCGTPGTTPSGNCLKKRIVSEANSNCNADGTSQPGKTCTPGLYWVRSSGATTRFTDNNSDCPWTGSPPSRCYQDLDLSAPQLWGTPVTDNTVNPPAVTTAASPNNRGPFKGHDPADNDPPLVKVLTSAEVTQLQQAINDILDFAIAAPASKKLCITGDITSGTNTYGTWAAPKITIVSDPNSSNSRLKALSNASPCSGAGGGGNDLDVKSGAIVNGAGVLIVPKRLRIKEATFNWRGVIVVLEDGDFRVDDDEACGAIIGAVLLQDPTGNDPKVDLDKVEQKGTSGVCSTRPPLGCDPASNPCDPYSITCPYSYRCSPFAVDYSCEAINGALGTLLMQTSSWTEQFGT